jgi:hypothetical protein
VIDHANREPFQKSDPLAKRRLECDLAAHRAFGDRRDLGFQPNQIRQLVDAFLFDHGGIHVGQEQALAASARRLDDDVDRLALKEMTESGFGFAWVGASGEKIGSATLGQDPVLGPAEHPPGFRQQRRRDGRLSRV